MSRVQWTPDAIGDLDAIRAWFNSISPALAQEQIDRVVLSTGWLVETPRVGRSITGRWRRWSVRRTPYILIYSVSREGIEIGRVLDRRSNSFWVRL